MFEELALTFIRFLESSQAASFERKKSAMKIEGGIVQFAKETRVQAIFSLTGTHS